MIIVILILNIIYCSQATLYIEGPCPNVTAVKNFNISAFARGIWYEIARYPNDFESNDDCTYADFDNSEGKQTFDIVGVLKRRPNIVKGFVDFAKDAGTDGIVNFRSASFEGPDDKALLPVYMIAVDYNKYLIAYECKYDEKRNIRHDFAWIDSRTKKFDSVTKKKVDAILSKSVINTKKLIWDHFSDDACKVDP